MQKHYSYCAYRLPYAGKPSYLKGFEKDGLKPGFLIAPFDLKFGFKSITDIEHTTREEINRNCLSGQDCNPIFKFPDKPTTREAHCQEVGEIKDFIDGDPTKKIIASRVIIRNGSIDVLNTFDNLCIKYPKSFIFFFNSPSAGCWIGASPELLLSCEKSGLCSYALAGTRAAGTDQPWDEKNIMEHEIVVKYISDVFKRNGLSPHLSERSTKTAGNIEHLLTQITIKEFEALQLQNLLKQLSPTPALSGYPKDEAIEMIHKFEKVPRGFYGGFIGPYHSPDNFQLFVNLRSVRIAPDCYCMHVGGGITSLSDPEDEWEETEKKAHSILSLLRFK